MGQNIKDRSPCVHISGRWVTSSIHCHPPWLFSVGLIYSTKQKKGDFGCSHTIQSSTKIQSNQLVHTKNMY